MEETGSNQFYQEWASQTKVSFLLCLDILTHPLNSIYQKAAEPAAELSPLKQTGSAVVFAPKAEQFRNQFVMSKADAVVGKL